MDNIFLVAALIYALLFWTLSWRFRGVALALIFGVAPFANDLGGGIGIGGVNFSIAEVNLVLCLPLVVAALIRGEKQVHIWPFFWPSAAFFVVCAASGFVEWRGSAALTSMLQMLLFMFVLIPVFSVLVRRPEDMLVALWTLLGSATFLAIVIIATRSQYVLGINKNGLGGSLGCAFLVAFELWFHFRARASWHRWAVMTLLCVIAGGLLLTLSRGGWIGTIAGVMLISLMRRQFALVGRIALLILPILALGWQLLPEESRSYATSFDAKRGNIAQRFVNQDFAIKTWEAHPILGGGIGIRKEYDSTQLVLFTLAETGVLGLITFIAVFAAFFRMIWKTQQRMPQGDMAFSLLAIGGALMLSRLGQGMVDHYWARGPTMMAWAAAGMATGVFLYGAQTSRSQRLKRARALLALHLLETRRRRGAQAAPALSKGELQRANEALALIMAERGLDPQTPPQSPNRAPRSRPSASS